MPFNQTSVLELTVFGRHTSGQQILNVYYYRQVSTVPQDYTNADAQEATNDFAVGWEAQILPILDQEYRVEKYRCRALTGTITNPTPPPPTQLVVGEQFEQIALATAIGQRPGPGEPSFSAIGAQKLSDRAGRNFRGSTRFGSISETDTVINAYTAAYLTLIQTNISAFFAVQLSLFFDAIPWEMAIFSRTLALAAPPPFTLLRDLTSKVVGARVNQFVTSQVSRKQSLTQPT